MTDNKEEKELRKDKDCEVLLDEVDKANADCSFAENETPPPSPPPEEPSIAILDPNHPLLKKFQDNLKQHLLSEKEKLRLDIFELKYLVKRKEKEREDLGCNLYEMQADLKHQSDLMEQHAVKIQQSLEEKEKEEKVIVDLKCELNKANCINKEQKNAYNKKNLDLENLQQLEARMRKWSEEFEDEVKNAQRIVSRDAQLQKQMSEEKRKGDLLFYHLDMEVQKKERELKSLQDEALDMREMVRELGSSLACANTDLEVLQSEQRRLTQAWGEVIVAIQYRDKILGQLNKQFTKDREEMKLAKSGIEAAQKHIVKETEQNKKLDSFRTRLLEDLTNLKVNLAKEATTLKELLEKAEQFPVLTERMEADLAQATKEGTHMETEMRRIQSKVDKQNRIKAEIEEQILKYVESQLISDKASEHRLKLLNKLQTARQQLELAYAESQNNLSTALYDIERLKGVIAKMRESNSRKGEKLREKDKKCDDILNEMKRIQTQIDIKMKKLEKLNRVLDQLINSPSENSGGHIRIKIKQAERAIAGVEQQIAEHQQFWILLQNHYVNLTQKRSAQLNDIQVTRKQLSIIKQKSYKIDQDLEASNLNVQDLAKEIQKYSKRVSDLNVKAFSSNQQHIVEEENCEYEHGDLMEKLRNNEMMVLQLEADITDLQCEIDHYKDLALDKHHEALSWETKYKLIDETLRWAKDEKASEGELGQMRSEIHRMQIRFNHLKKAQEKLVQDLDQCIMHRENIFMSSNLKNALIKKNIKKFGVSVIQQKINDMRNKLKQIHNEIKKAQNIENVKLRNEQDSLYRAITQIQNELQREAIEMKIVCDQIEEQKLVKFYNLEQIVRKQTKAKYYRHLVSSRVPPKILKSESAIEADTNKQMEINETMTDLVNSLASEFPKINHWFFKIAQILKD